MKILTIDPTGAGLDFAMRCTQAGHTVKVFITQTEKTKYIGRGLVTIIDDFRPHLKWADLVFVTDNTKYLREIDAWRRDHNNVFGCTNDAANWELDRGIGQDIFEKHNIAVPPSECFTDYDKAIAYVKKTMRRYVSKPSGDADKALSYCSHDPADMVFMLERWKKLGKLKSPFILQEFIPGTEMAVGAFFGPDGFNAGWCENFEFKKLMDGDKGVATGEQGTVLRFVRSSKLARKVLEPLTDALAKLNYTGYVDVNCIIDEQGTPWPLEFTMRPGWPTFNIQQALNLGDPAEWMLDLLEGRDAKNFSLDTVAIGVVLSIPDYPYSHLTQKEVVGIPVYGIKPAMWRHLHPCEMMLSDPVPVMQGGKLVHMPMPATAGDYVLVASGCGETVLEAKKSAYRRLERLTLPNSPMYRTDIGDRLSRQLPTIQSQGYATNLIFSKAQQS